MADSDSDAVDEETWEATWEALYQLRLQRRPKLLKAYAPRCPMEQLRDEFRVTKSNPSPPTVHYGIPLEASDLREYAERRNRDPERFAREVPILSEKVNYPLGLCVPFGPTTDSQFILELYSNYTMGNKQLIEEDEEDVISMVKEELKLDPSVRPKWYFDQLDPWVPSVRDQLRLERDLVEQELT